MAKEKDNNPAVKNNVVVQIHVDNMIQSLKNIHAEHHISAPHHLYDQLQQR
jgi:predicted ATPase